MMKRHKKIERRSALCTCGPASVRASTHTHTAIEFYDCKYQDISTLLSFHCVHVCVSYEITPSQPCLLH